MSKNLTYFFESVLFTLLLSFAVVLAVDRTLTLSVSKGISLWAVSVLPALFPYFFITAILSALSVTEKLSNFISPLTKKVFNVGGSVGYAFIISLLSGYPVGAKTVADLKNNNLISESESVRASAICSTSSPMFLMGSVGNIMFNSTLFGLLLFLSQLISSVLIGIIFSFYKRSDKPSREKNLHRAKTTDNILYDSVFSSVISVLTVGGLITVFYLATDLLSKTKLLCPLEWLFTLILGEESGQAFTFGLIECTRGLQFLSQSGITGLALPLSSALCGFGGFCVITQSIAILKSAKIKTAPFLYSKVLSAVLNFTISLILSFIFF